MMKNTAFTALSLLLAALVACQKEPTLTQLVDGGSTDEVAAKNIPILPAVPYNYANVALPAYLNTPLILGQKNLTSQNNPITDNGASLGRVLFYDRNLSFNNSISCASCHQQNAAFSDPAVFSTGFAGGLTGRNSMSLVNAAYYPDGHFFWDERASNIEKQASGPITNPVEMGMTMPRLVSKLKRVSYYPTLFKKAYGTETIDSARIVMALSQFVRSIVSYQSPYDEGRASLPPGPPPPPNQLSFSNFTAEENQGMQIFFAPGSCAACHGTETFVAPGPRNNGLDLAYSDNGLGALSGNTQQNGLFKVPSLRNVELSAPYMHDGRFKTLEEVVEHYSSGVKNHPNLSPPLRNPNGTVHLLNLSESQKAAVVAFLKTLTDNSIASDPKFSNPF